MNLNCNLYKYLFYNDLEDIANGYRFRFQFRVNALRLDFTDRVRIMIQRQE